MTARIKTVFGWDEHWVARFDAVKRGGRFGLGVKVVGTRMMRVVTDSDCRFRDALLSFKILIKFK